MTIRETIFKKREEKIQVYKEFMPDLINSDEIIRYLDSVGYFTAPSSFKRHGAWIGGNFDHRHSEKSLEMLSKIIELTIEEKLCIYYHMGEHEDDYEYRILMEKMIEKYPNIQLTQIADTKAAEEGI